MIHSDIMRGTAMGHTNTDSQVTTLAAAAAALCPPEAVAALVRAALEEDGVTQGDITTTTIIEPGRLARGRLVARTKGVVAGLDPLVHLLTDGAMQGRLQMTPRTHDGALVAAGDTLAVLAGGARSLLAMERTLLNLLGHLCGIATLTRRYVDAVAGTSAAIYDTRKTLPGLRGLEKYAVRCGGGMNHRLGLHDAALYKDNHLAGIPLNELGDRLGTAIAEARADRALQFVEVEVDTLVQLDALLSMPPGLVDVILLDNMDAAMTREAVTRRNARGDRPALEASGGVNIDSVRGLAQAGVERIAIGALTHSAASLDIGLDIESGAELGAGLGGDLGGRAGPASGQPASAEPS